jgi:sterol desaturase/sphingolipid hydroxylase (fatty acid hydroxylase superfamily)
MTWFDFIYHRILFTQYGAIGFVLLMYIVLGAFEVLAPAESAQQTSRRGINVGISAIYLVFGGLLVRELGRAISAGNHHATDGGLFLSLGLIAAYGFIADFIYYWYHRAQHTFRFLWVIHELHHTDTTLNATTSLRTFWLEAPVQRLLIGIPAHWLIGLDLRAILLVPAVYTGWLMFTHSNWRLSLGPLTPIICGPQLHRTHHSNLPEHHNKNFAQNFPFIDILFGTYYAPRRDEFPTTGVGQRTAQASIAEISVSPFQEWARSFVTMFAKASEPTRKAPAGAASRRHHRSSKRRRAR